MPTRTFRVFGSVADTQTKKGISGLRVEVWNSPAAAHLILGSGLTDVQGQFDIAAVAEVTQGTATGGAGAAAGGSTGVVPATIRIFQGQQSLPISGQPDIPDLFKYKGPTALQVHPDQPQAVLKDRVTVAQAFQGVDFIHKSDFRGLFQEGRSRASSVGSLVTASLLAAAKSTVAKPMKPAPVRNSDVVNQDSLTAQRRLNQQQIKSTVQPYQPGLGTLGDVTSVSRTLKPGDTVVLYQQNGIVKSYQIQKAATPAAADTTKLSSDLTSLQGEVHTLEGRNQEIDALKSSQQQQTDTITALQQKAALVDGLQAQLAKVQSDSAQKDQTIAKLQSDVATVTRAHADLAAQITPARLAALEDSVKKLQKPPTG
ncbi:MAG: hypothetical protein LAP21_07965 [Acidobacteriia bacterium]|nr:hypothetical protein [Terriglobia bacterium]